MRLIGSFFLASVVTLIICVVLYALAWLFVHFGIVAAIIGAVVVVLTVAFYLMLDD